MGRSRGGLTTRIHAVTDANGLPITLKLTAGQAHDGRSADDMLGTVGAGQALLADAACDSNRLRDHLARVGAKAVIKPIPTRTAPPELDKNAYRRRNKIERVRLFSRTDGVHRLTLKAQALQGSSDQI